MKRFCVWLLLVLGVTLSSPATIRYVAQGNPTPVAPYTDWSTAATQIQAAVDACVAGDTVLVSNGVYNTGVRRTPVYNSSNRLVITNLISVRSVNGPDFTQIIGAGTSASNAIRCVFITSNASLAGFTLLNGYADVLIGSDPYDTSGGGVFIRNGATVSNCTIANCTAPYGGGACIALIGSLLGCTLRSNYATSSGGGLRLYNAASGVVDRCRIEINNAHSGGGVYLQSAGRVANSLIAANWAANNAGAVLTSSATTNVILTGCTIVANVAPSNGGIWTTSAGVYVRSSIVWGNTNGNWSGGSYSNCVTAPLPAGAGNQTNDPLFADAAYHLSITSPAIGAGNNEHILGMSDLDGNVRLAASNVDVGCYENAMDTNLFATVPAVPYGPSSGIASQALGYVAYGATATIGGVDYRFDWGDGTFSGWSTGGTTYAWSSPGLYTVRAQARPTLNPSWESAWSTGLVVTIGVATNVTVTVPVTPYGPLTVFSGQTNAFQTFGSLASDGGGVEYRYDWDDAQFSSWHTGTAQHAWSSAGVFVVRAQARPTSNPNFESAWNTGLIVTVVAASNIVATVPSSLSGPTTNVQGFLNNYLVSGSTASDGGDVQYRIDWGDAQFSTWNTGGATRTWSTAGVYWVRAQARPNGFPANETPWSTGLVVTILNSADISATTPLVPVGSISGAIGSANSYQAIGSTGNDGRSVQYRFDWGDAQFSAWGTGVASHAWSTTGSYLVKAQARPPLNPTNESAWSAGLVVTISTASVPAIVRYVAPGGAHISPFDTWANAATNMQAAIDACPTGGTVLVSNGVYAAGQRGVAGTVLSNRVVITNNITVASVNGPAVTIIQGEGYAGTGGLRCVWLAGNSRLSGFTLRGGSTRNSSFPQVPDNSGGGLYITGGGIASNCIVRGGWAAYGGGVCIQFAGTLVGSTVVSNQASNFGGGIRLATATNGYVDRCVIQSNYANSGGGVVLYTSGRLVDSLIAYNLGSNFAGGIQVEAGGALALIDGCTIAGNRAFITNAAIHFNGAGATVRNSILWANTNGNWSGTNFIHCISRPLPPGVGNSTNDPIFVDAAYHIDANSPALEMGNNAYVTNSTDLDGNPRIAGASVDAGCYELPIDTNLIATVPAIPLGPATGMAWQALGYVAYGATVTNGGVAYRFDWGDGTFSGWNTGGMVHVWSVPGLYAVRAQARATMNPAGESPWSDPLNVNITLDAGGPATRYVALGGGNVPPFTSWATAATTLQAAVDYALPGDLVLVTNGLYQSGQRITPGGTVSNRVVITNEITVRSVNGSAVTHIYGGSVFDTNRLRCVYITAGRLEGFSLTNGLADKFTGDPQLDRCGGGAYADGGTLANCVIGAGRAGSQGGGVFRGLLINCNLTGNYSLDVGGAAAGSTLIHCTVRSNAAANAAGGVYACQVTNSIVYHNSSGTSANHTNSAFAYSCTSPLPAGPGNTAADPQFVNVVTDPRVRGSSPCIDAAMSLDDVTNDFLYAPRPIDGNGDENALPDMGAYEMATVHYVAPGGAHVPPFATWANASTTIQAAADVALSGDTVLVSNGIYATGTRSSPGSSGTISNRLLITNTISVRSVNGPAVTVIQGAGSLGATSMVRCVFMTNVASLSGFTLSGGFTRISGSNVADIAGGGVLGSGTNNITVSNCVITGCGAVNGGGAAQVTLVNCDLVGNVATNLGGGLYQSSLNRGRLIGNTAYGSGGGAYLGLLTNVLVASNVAYNGGGAWGGALTFCTVANNQAWLQGGVASVTGLNCIVYQNTAFSNANHGSSTLRWTCTTPLPVNGFACISNAPVFVGIGDYRLRADSPCIDAGTNNIASRDLNDALRPVDGNDDTLAVADMGALEYDPATQDSDGDGFTDAVEHATGSDPVNALSQPTGIAGQVLYAGTQTGTVFLLVNGLTNQSLAIPGPYALTNVANLVAYTLAAFRDANGNGGFDPWEPAGTYPANPLVFTQSVGNADITLVEDQLVDTDGDGLPDYAEVYTHGTDPFSADTDQDGINDSLEFVHGSNPNDPASTLVSATGTVVYAGAQTGTVYLLVDARTNGTIAGPGPFVLSNLVTQTDHVFAAYLDASGNGGFDPWEPSGVFTGSPVVVTGSLDGIEIVLTENALVDSDGDGLSDFVEVYTHGTDPNDADTDHDGTPDGVEITYALAPLDPGVFFTRATGSIAYAGTQTGAVHLLVDGATNSSLVGPGPFAVSNLLSTTSHVFFAFLDASGNGALDPWEPAATHPESPFVFTQPVVNVSWELTEDRVVDADHDGLADYDEVYVHHTDPYVVTTNVDSDADGLSDYAEMFTFLTDPHEQDTDHDGLTDGFEVLTYFTDPLDADTDGDGFSDGEEFQRGTNPRGFKSPSHLADFDGDGRADLAVFHAQQGDWHIVASLSGTPSKTPWGSKSSIPAPADYDGDGRADIAYYLPDSGDWYVRGNTGVVVRMTNSAPVPVPADYDGDGIDDFALYKKSTGDWTIRRSSTGQMMVRNWGWADAMPVPADYDGDGRDDLAVYHPKSGNWHLLESRSNTMRVINWGWPAAQPVPGDYDGDGRAELAVFHRLTGQWYLRGPTGQLTKFKLGSMTMAPVPADFDGDGRTDAAVYQPADGAWLIRWSSPHIQTTINWGWRDARPVLRQYQINRAYGFIP